MSRTERVSRPNNFSTFLPGKKSFPIYAIYISFQMKRVVDVRKRQTVSFRAVSFWILELALLLQTTAVVVLHWGCESIGKMFMRPLCVILWTPLSLSSYNIRIVLVAGRSLGYSVSNLWLICPTFPGRKINFKSIDSIVNCIASAAKSKDRVFCRIFFFSCGLGLF